MISEQEKKFLFKKHLKEGMSIKDIQKYFERFMHNLKKNNKKNKKYDDIKESPNLNELFKIDFRHLY